MHGADGLRGPEMTGHRISIGKARLTPQGKIEPKRTWARAKDHRKAARLEKKWRATGKVRGK